MHHRAEEKGKGLLNSARKGKTTKRASGKPEFHIRLHHRQNASWQGELYWLNTGERVCFRSLLELVALIQEAADITFEPEAEEYLRSWDKKQEKVSTL